MCDECMSIQEQIVSKSIKLDIIQKLIDDEKLELYAANCYPNEILKHMDVGNHYTINTYYHCKNCDRYYYVGFCLYGNPIIKEVDDAGVTAAALRFEWGFIGSFFENDINREIVRRVIYHYDIIIAPVWSWLIDAFGYGTATPVQALISTLKILWERIQKGQTVYFYFPAGTKKQEINISTFDDIIKKYFSEFVLNEVKSN